MQLEPRINTFSMEAMFTFSSTFLYDSIVDSSRPILATSLLGCDVTDPERRATTACCICEETLSELHMTRPTQKVKAGMSCRRQTKKMEEQNDYIKNENDHAIKLQDFGYLGPERNEEGGIFNRRKLDVKKNTWTKRIYVLPFMWWNIVATTKLRIVGMIGTSEIVLSPYDLSDPYYLFYYNLETNNVREVGIQGLGAFETSTVVHLFVDYEEDVKLYECLKIWLETS
uniref:Uncharacterized protein At2g25390 n=1 Tax=Arabidopsis thaliana TaxID=3702 RepID=Q9SKK9_ARATH|nr:hypothetical protein [Arabidopsis thaliana]AAM15378.1 hypothetical protein [Arabidopsis thaliana]